jgi:hypothetical protein
MSLTYSKGFGGKFSPATAAATGHMKNLAASTGTMRDPKLRDEENGIGEIQG